MFVDDDERSPDPADRHHDHHHRWGEWSYLGSHAVYIRVNPPPYPCSSHREIDEDDDEDNA